MRTWWRQLYGDDSKLDDTHLMRLAGRFGRRVYAYCKANQIAVIRREAKERGDEISPEHVEASKHKRGLFLVIVSRAPAPLIIVMPVVAILPFPMYYRIHVILQASVR